MNVFRVLLFVVIGPFFAAFWSCSRVVQEPDVGGSFVNTVVLADLVVSSKISNDLNCRCSRSGGAKKLSQGIYEEELVYSCPDAQVCDLVMLSRGGFIREVEEQWRNRLRLAQSEAKSVIEIKSFDVDVKSKTVSVVIKFQLN